MLVASEVDAFRIDAFVFAFTFVCEARILADSDDDARLVFALTAEVIPDVCEFVLAFTSVVTLATDVPSDVEAFRIDEFVLLLIVVTAPLTWEFVLPFTLAVSAVIAEAREEEAEVISDNLAREPDDKVASVRLRVANVQTSEAVIPVDTLLANCFPIVPAPVRVEVAMFQTSAARVPKFDNVLVYAPVQTAVGIVEASDDEAVSTVAFVLLLIVVIADEICELVYAFMFEASDEEADRMEALVFALMLVCAFVMLAASELEAKLVLALIAP